MKAESIKIKNFKFFTTVVIILFSLCRYAAGTEVEGKANNKPANPELLEVLLPVTANLGDYRKLTIEISTDITEADEYIPEFKTALSNKIEESKLFERIVNDGSNDILMKIKIVAFHKASNWRFLLGFAAGALIDSTDGTAVIELIETKTGKVIGSCKAKAKGQTLNYVYGGISDSIIAFLKQAKEKPPAQAMMAATKPAANIDPQRNNMDAVTSLNKLDALRKDGVISEEEYKRAKEKIEPQTDNTDTDKKLQELGELRKSGVLSEADYNKAKKRLAELQKLNELRQGGVLSEDEYNKAKARLTEK